MRVNIDNAVKLFGRASIQVELVRFCVAAVVLASLGIIGNVIGLTIPVVHFEPILLAPFLERRISSILLVGAFSVALGRIAQSFFGFDQIFVSSYLLLHNLGAFPVRYAVMLVFAVFLLAAAVYYGLRRLPVKRVKVGAPLIFFIMLGLATAKYAEDFSKTNLVGSEYGHVFGQLRFVSLFHASYETPGPRVETYPGTVAANVAAAQGSGLLLIVVESMGYPNDQLVRSDMLSPILGNAAISDKYRIRSGSVPSYGSTIHGELRQLCNGRLVDGLFGHKNTHCIPNQLKIDGYKTVAVHANKSSVYGRDEWYGGIGFDEYISADTPIFPKSPDPSRWGVLDDIRTLNFVKNQVKPGPGKMVYLLTVTTHMPAIAMNGVVLNGDCLKRMDEQVCTHTGNLKLVLSAIADLALTLHNTVVVVAGDHPPPFSNFMKSGAFDKTNVPYFILVPRDGRGN